MANNCDPITRVCIQTKKVFDACIKQASYENVSIVLTETNPANPTLPLTFVGGRSTSIMAEVTNLVVTRLQNRPRYGRVEADLVIPIQINYTDATGTSGVGTGTLTLHQDVIMLLPEASIMPYQVEAVVSVIVPEGTFNASATDLTFVVTTCVAAIMKIVITAELIVPSYGYAVIPPCQEYNQEVCAGFFDLPLFPGTGPEGGNNVQ